MKKLAESIARSTNSTFEPPEVISEYECPRCGSDITVLKAVVLGEERIIDRCIECENIEMARKAEETRLLGVAKKARETFDHESLINEDLKNATFDTYQPDTQLQDKAKRIAQRYVDVFDQEVRNILFAGTYGIGKSHLAKAITDELINKGKSCIFISVPRLFTKVKSTWGKRSSITEEDITAMLAKVDCLVLDDIGAEHIQTDENGTGRGWGVTKIFEIIDTRQGKHTIFTTNLDNEQMESRFGARNFSRLMMNTTPVLMDGEDYRLREFKGA